MKSHEGARSKHGFADTRCQTGCMQSSCFNPARGLEQVGRICWRRDCCIAAAALHTEVYEEQRPAGVTSPLHTIRFWPGNRMGLLVCMRGREELLDFARLQSASTNNGAAENAPVSSEEPCRMHCMQRDALLAGCIACSKRAETHCG